MTTTQLAPDDDGAVTGTVADGTMTGTVTKPADVAAARPATSYPDLQRSPEFADLRRRLRRFVFPLTALFLAWYFLYVSLAAFVPGFMGTELFGNIHVGLVFGLGQFVSTFAITMIYARWAERNLDPAAEALRTRFEAAHPDTARLDTFAAGREA